MSAIAVVISAKKAGGLSGSGVWASVFLYLVLILGGAAATPSSTTSFSLRSSNGVWSFVAPDGESFFSQGVCVVDQGTPREAYDPENPSYASWRQYSDPRAWADETLRRLKSWRFTTLGGWADQTTLSASKECSLCFAPVLHLGASAGVPWWDMWDRAIVQRMREQARHQIPRLKKQGRILGYYSDNELGWWNATLWKMTLEQPSSSGQRRRLVAELRRHYSDDWAALRRDFDAENANRWPDLEKRGALYLKSGGRGIVIMRRFLGMLAQRYYSLMRELIREQDPKALYLGDRYQSFYYPEVAEAAAKSVDVISSNVNATWNDGSIPRFQLESLYQLTGKPIVVTEIYQTARENSSGNRNSWGAYPLVDTQEQRALAARRTLESLAGLPYVVGIDWFQFYDEPTNGRDDGEDFNFGLVDVEGRPYQALTSVFTHFAPLTLRAMTPKPRATVMLGVPPAPNDPLAHFKGNEALAHWDRERGFVPAASAAPLADLYLCWNAKSLFVGVVAHDMVESAYYRSAVIPKQDRALLSVSVNGSEPIQVRLGAGRQPLVNRPEVRVKCLSGFNQSVRTVAALEIPSGLFGGVILKDGSTIDLRCFLDTHFKAARYQWTGSYRCGAAGSPLP